MDKNEESKKRAAEDAKSDALVKETKTAEEKSATLSDNDLDKVAGGIDSWK